MADTEKHNVADCASDTLRYVESAKHVSSGAIRLKLANISPGETNTLFQDTCSTQSAEPCGLFRRWTATHPCRIHVVYNSKIKTHAKTEWIRELILVLTFLFMHVFGSCRCLAQRHKISLELHSLLATIVGNSCCVYDQNKCFLFIVLWHWRN